MKRRDVGGLETDGQIRQLPLVGRNRRVALELLVRRGPVRAFERDLEFDPREVADLARDRLIVDEWVKTFSNPPRIAVVPNANTTYFYPV